MDALNSDSEHLFSLPVVLIFQNESSGEEQGDLGYNTSATAAVNETQSSHNWKKDDGVLSGLQKLERVGDTIRKELKWAFILHAYGFGCLFFILAFYTFLSILNIRSFISSRPFMTTINGFLCLLGTSRGASLFIDPYSLKESMSKLFGQVLWDLGFPSIISAFCLVQLAFLQFTQLQIGPKGLRRKTCLSLIVTAHFLLTIGVDLVTASHESLMVVVKHIFHYVFLTWGVFLCSNFLYTGYKVMSMIRKIPGGSLDPGYKVSGIMQLGILASQSNLSSSMASALLPTLCTPKIHQLDNNNLSAVGFPSDGNSRILESESIPIFEEMTGSSGDEINLKSVGRRSSFRNQASNHSQKFNLRPKLSFSSASNQSKDEEDAQVRGPCSGMRSSKSMSSKVLSFKTNELDCNYKSNNGILKLGRNKESLPQTKSLHESKIKKHTTSDNDVENENFHVGNENKLKSNFHPSAGFETPNADNITPKILVTKSDSSVNDKVAETMETKNTNFLSSEKNKKTLCKLMSEISRDLNEMQILREGKISTRKTEETVKVHASKINEFDIEPGNGLKNKMDSEQCVECKIKIVANKKENLLCKKEYRSSTCSTSRKQCGSSKFETLEDTKEAVNMCPSLSEIDRLEETKLDQKKFQVRGMEKSLRWKIKAENQEKEEEDEEEECVTQECLLLQKKSSDVTLRSALNHMAYINRETLGKADNYDELEKVRKSKVEWMLNITYITAMWGLMLCLSNMGKIYSPFGVPESPKEIFYSNTTYIQSKASTEENENKILFSSWPWLWFQTFCRALELAMGCAMANITRQPTANHRYSRTARFRHRGIFYNI